MPLIEKVWVVKLGILWETQDVRIEACVTVSPGAGDVVNTSQVCYTTPRLTWISIKRLIFTITVSQILHEVDSYWRNVLSLFEIYI